MKTNLMNHNVNWEGHKVYARKAIMKNNQLKQQATLQLPIFLHVALPKRMASAQLKHT